jgi:hypothetical protein
MMDGVTAFFSAGVLLINILALSLLFYRHSRLSLAWGALAFLLGLLINVLLIQAYPLYSALFFATSTILLLLLGSMILSGHRFHIRLIILLSFIVGVLSNMESSVSDFATGGGFVLAAVVTFILSTTFVQILSSRVRPIGVRVAGSWITAIALIYIAYHFQ